MRFGTAQQSQDQRAVSISEGTSGCARKSPRVTAVFHPDKIDARLAGFFAKPSDGLEPSTPSLPWKFGDGTGVHGRSFAAAFVLQIDVSDVPPVPARDRSCSRSCTRLVPAARCPFSKHPTRRGRARSPFHLTAPATVMRDASSVRPAAVASLRPRRLSRRRAHPWFVKKDVMSAHGGPTQRGSSLPCQSARDLIFARARHPHIRVCWIPDHLTARWEAPIRRDQCRARSAQRPSGRSATRPALGRP